ARPSRRERSLIDWRDTAHNMQVLDWRGRARRYGLTVDEENGVDEELHGLQIDDSPGHFVEEEEPETLEPTLRIDQDLDEEPVEEDLDVVEPVEPAVEEAITATPTSPEDVDLVRVYLNHIGRRPLLDKTQEQELGLRIEQARAELLAAMSSIPAALATILDLAQQVRKGTAPASELILLPDGGELTPGKIAPMLRDFERLRRLDRSI